MLIGYIRVSTNDQNTDLQRIALQSADCELIFEDRISGKTRVRPGLKKALRCLQAGDTLVVWKLDRLGRSMRHLVMLTEELRERGVNFRSLTDSIDTSTPMGRFFFHVMGALAEMERELIVERTRAGLAAAREKGRVGGRRRVMTADVTARAERMLVQGATMLQVSLVLEVSVKTLYRYIPAARLRELEDESITDKKTPQPDQVCRAEKKRSEIRDRINRCERIPLLHKWIMICLNREDKELNCQQCDYIRGKKNRAGGRGSKLK